ncbi:sigma 54-interacting transcriptional regulator [Sporosarcina siberiensis]|uniref:HTH-type transcriptional regulatory protein TyrR n=1 Tax=Sporosarcina siberiensis TaxID=1365606 RepID=A0ABW4SES7_9BACL
MIVKEVMKKNLVKYYANDCILKVTSDVMERDVEGGLVYNESDELVGWFTYKELLNGIIQNYTELDEVCIRDYLLIDENSAIKNLDFTTYGLFPVLNVEEKITGFITRGVYLNAVARLSQIEKNRLDAIFNSAHNGILSIDLEGRITAINPPAERMALTTKEKALGKFLNEVVIPSGLLNVIRTGRGHTEKYKVGNRMYLAHRSPIYDGKSLIGAVGVFQDISEIEIVSSELDSVKQLVNEMDTIINNSSDGICITDTKGNIINRNIKFDDIYYGNLSEEEKNNGFHTMIEQVVEEGTRYNLMETNIRNNSSLIISAIPVKNSDNKIERIVVSVKDVAEIDNLRRELEKTQFILKNMQDELGEKEFVASSQSMKDLILKIDQVAKVDVTVLLTGERGVGKNELASLIKESSSRKNKPFIKVNCDAIPEDLMEAELFGRLNGTEENGYAGFFEHADGGTLFLDEVGKIPLHLQVKLLKVLQEQKVNRIGSKESIEVDVRIIAASSEDLLRLVKEGTFREDLFYRINVIPLEIPPLRERLEDIPLLIEEYSNLFANKYKKRIDFSSEIIETMKNYEWPGNVRELINILERVYVTSSEKEITVESMKYIMGEREKLDLAHQKPFIINKVMPLKQAVEEFERELIAKVGETENSYRKIAKILEVSPSTVMRKSKKLD